MTTGPGIYQMGGGGSPFDPAAQDVLGSMRRHMGGPQPYARPLTPEERQEADQQPERCLFCAGIHAGMSTPACPRLASFKLDGDQRVIEGTFWEGTAWAEGRVLLAEQVAEEETTGEEGGGDN